MVLSGVSESMSWPLVLLTVFASIGGFLFGYDTGVVSGVTLFWQNDTHLGLSDLEIEHVVAVTVGTAALGTALSGMPLQWYGRRPLIMVASLYFSAGSVVLAVATDFFSLLVGRLLLGFGVGLSSIAVPVYLAEMSPPTFRGRIVSCYTLSIVAGQAIACGVNVICDRLLGPSDKWRVSLGLAGVPAVFQFCGFWLGLPESPRWLAARGRTAEAKAVLAFIRGVPTAEQPQEEAPPPGTDCHTGQQHSPLAAVGPGNEAGGSANGDRHGGGGGSGAGRGGVALGAASGGARTPTLGGESAALLEADWAALQALPVEDVGNFSELVREVKSRPHLRRIFGLGMGLQVLQQLSGINTIMYYGASIMVMCGFKSSQSVELAAILAISQAAGILASSPLFDKYGRRALVLPSCVASGLCLVLVALAFALGIHSHQEWALFGIIMYLACFGLGLSPGPWVINSEIYPLHVRGLGNSAATTANWVVNYVVSATFLTLAKVLGRPAVFGALAAACFVGAAWLFYALPETSGKTLEEVELLFKRPGDVDPYDSPGREGDEDEEGDEGGGNGARNRYHQRDSGRGEGSGGGSGCGGSPKAKSTQRRSRSSAGGYTNLDRHTPADLGGEDEEENAEGEEDEVQAVRGAQAATTSPLVAS